MNIEEVREYCLRKQQVTEGFPFDESTLVFKVVGKLFLLCGLNAEETSINIKCDPERAISLREEYNGIISGYHMNKKHWNTVALTDDVPQPLILELIDHSYELVIKGMPKKIRLTFG